MCELSNNPRDSYNRKTARTHNQDNTRTENNNRGDQNGFTAGRSCNDNIFSIKQVTDKRKLKNLEEHLISIGLEKGFDTVPVQELFEIARDAACQPHFKIYIESTLNNWKIKCRYMGIPR